MSDAVAHATMTFAATTSAVNGTGRGGGAGNLATLDMNGDAPSGEAAAGEPCVTASEAGTAGSGSRDLG